MNILIIAVLAVLIVLGFKQPLLWVAAAVLVYFLVRHHTGGSARPGPTSGGVGASGSGGAGGGAGGGSGGGGSGGGGGIPSTYRDYRIRRDRQERWDRRYRRTHPAAQQRRK
ncbi:hypothetical protein [Streptomyces flavofungini]|uniref:Uncharacterized protein n=1 Tax=Streptomyces flavofungini TaxID=68200 RepID=A0ABS0XDJ4_9ACTN|nr:hypothetical protein [Streptomyces flavofungini]MBJ3810994.1 hypothetical protein [Streptomyces flavofungini]GHC40957.1 hypothetical protein GCM10010349_00780 [Streptomyces flavofungini]